MLMASKNKKPTLEVDTKTTDSIFLKDSLQDLISRGFDKFQFLKDNNNNGKTVWIIVAYKTTTT